MEKILKCQSSLDLLMWLDVQMLQCKQTKNGNKNNMNDNNIYP